jgi:hypothetical protein
MEIEVKPSRSDVSHDRAEHGICPTHGGAQPTYAMSDPRRTDVPQQRVVRVNPPRRAKDMSIRRGPRSGNTSAPAQQLHTPASTVPRTPS